LLRKLLRMRINYNQSAPAAAPADERQSDADPNLQHLRHLVP
jgi:hypothetical protein